MSAASRAVLGLSVVLTLGTVAGVHIQQSLEREKLHQGVLRDLERLERKKENLRVLEEQRSLTLELEAERDRREAQNDQHRN